MLKENVPNLTITMFPASYGDSFLISVPNEKLNMLIDAGFKSTYKNYIKPALDDLRSTNQKLNFLIITHVDADHISGAVALLEDNQKQDVIKIGNIWHNSYRHLQSNTNGNTTNLPLREKRLLQQISAVGYPSEQTTLNDKRDNISAEQGSSLASMIVQGNYVWNGQTNGQAIKIENIESASVSDNVKLEILTPNEHLLQNLKSFWKKELSRKGFRKIDDYDYYFDDAFEFLVSHDNPKTNDKKIDISFNNIELNKLSQEPFEEDTSDTNGSSITFILVYNNIRILFLGDAHPSTIEQELKRRYKTDKIWFDAIKIAHHGSKGNTSPTLLQLIDSDTFFISTNGNKHSHPDLVTLSRIVCRPTETFRKLIFNYKTEVSNTLDNPNLSSQFNYTVQYAENAEAYTF